MAGKSGGSQKALNACWTQNSKKRATDDRVGGKKSKTQNTTNRIRGDDPGEDIRRAGASSNRCPGTILGLGLKSHKNCVWTISSESSENTKETNLEPERKIT